MLALEYEEDSFVPDFPSVSPYFFYKIVCTDSTVKKVYVGKTKDLKSRIACHKSKSYDSDIKVYQHIRLFGGWDNWELTVLHKCICDEATSVYIEVALIKQFKDEKFEMLNCQLPMKYARQQYNIGKCKEHYAIKKTCDCGWVGSKMDWSHHKQSKRHIKYCIELFEANVLSSC
jgi:hypothetical protein